MKTLTLLLALLGAPLLAHAAHAQDANTQDAPVADGTVIESAEVLGLALDQLSAQLRQDIERLAGIPLNRERINALAARIETEHPEVVLAVRDVLRPDSRVHIVFVVAPISDDTNLASNINARYTVERVEIAGVDETLISQKSRDQLQALVGGTLNPSKADLLRHRLENELEDYDVTRSVARGTAPGHIRVVFTFTKAERRPWIRWQPAPAKLVYHQKQGWSGAVNIVANGRREQVLLGLVGGNSDDLVEEYTGYILRFEHREAGTKRLGMSMEFSRFTQSWRDATLSTLDVNPGIPPAYKVRKTVQPAVTFAFSRHLQVIGGASVSTLTALADPSASERARAGFAGISFDRTWRQPGGATQRLETTYQVRAGTTALGSDLVYKRHFAEATYRQHHGRSTLTARFLVGGLTGQAPLFERFTLGDTSTLRGWNKYDIAPIGGDRVVHQSLEYRYRGLAYFLDVGSVWDTGTDARVRLSTGVGFHSDHAFLTLGVPLNADRTSVNVMLGVSF